MRVDRARSVLEAATAGGAQRARAALRALAEEASAEIGRAARIERAVDLRLSGQSFELTVPYADLAGAVAAFHTEHERRYGFAARDRAVEIVTARASAIAPGQELGEAAGAFRGEVVGPAIVPFGEATCIVPAGWRGRIRRGWHARPAGDGMSIETQVIAAALRGVADEMGAALIRSAVSPNIKERRDCSTRGLRRRWDADRAGRAHPRPSGGDARCGRGARARSLHRPMRSCSSTIRSLVGRIYRT